jgi:hypothetical protein
MWFCCGSCRCVSLQRHKNGEEYSVATLFNQFCVKLREGATDICGKIHKEFGNDSLSRVQLFQWHKDFSICRETAEDKPRSGEQAQTSTMWGLSFVKVDVWQVEWSPMNLLFMNLRSTKLRIRDSAVGIATGYGLDDWGIGVRVPVGSRIFSSPCSPDCFWGPPNFLSNGYRRAFSPGIKRPGRKSDHLLSTTAEIKKMWMYVSTTPIPLHGVMLN